MGTTATPAPRPPAHLWLVAALSLLWNAFGVFDFVMTNLREAAYVAQLPPAMIDYIDAFPFWVIIAWAAGVSFALLGSVLLFARSVWAVHAFALSLLGLALTQAYQVAAGTPPEMETALNRGMTAAIWIVTAGELLYALRMRRREVLR